MEKIHYTNTLVVVVCGECGTTFAIEEFLQRELQKSKRTFFCPNGHARAYIESEADRLRTRLQNVEHVLAEQRRYTEEVERSRTALRGVITRTKKRIAAGTCPVCKRTFQALQRHMCGQHPEYVNHEEK